MSRISVLVGRESATSVISVRALSYYTTKPKGQSDEIRVFRL